VQSAELAERRIENQNASGYLPIAVVHQCGGSLSEAQSYFYPKLAVQLVA
jgi:hypothetical protein